MNGDRFSLSDVRYVKRITVGNDNPNRIQPKEEIQQAQELLNRCLSSSPRGTILGTEKGFYLLNLGEHQVVLQWVVYHVGFPRKPSWLE